MKHGTTRTRLTTAGIVATAAAVAAVSTGSGAAAADQFAASSVPANPAYGVQGDMLAPGLDQSPVAYGALPLADPSGGTTHYGYETSNGGPLTQDPREAYKTEPDKNVYLVLGEHHYLYQGHEGGPHGYVTRVDLDQPDLRRRVTLIADGQDLPTFDGITWDPFSRQLLLTAEATAPHGGVYGVPLDAQGDSTGPATPLAALGSGGYEGVQNDSAGNVWLVEDVGGPKTNGGKLPNSYVYRFTPTTPGDLSTGTLQALQVLGQDGSPVDGTSDAFVRDLHTYGASFSTRWVTVTPEDATAGAKAAGATPLKRPENGVFRPGTSFGEFYFTETGDTTTGSSLPGAYGGVFRITQSSPSAATGTLSPAYLGDREHTGLDNIAFATPDQLLVVEDAGDGLHAQRDALDSGYLIDLRKSYAHGLLPVRWLAEGRDASATYDHDAHEAGTAPAYNDGDNEITGIHVSDGDPSTAGILGAKSPTPFANGWRVFWTQQHGDNITWEVRPAAPAPARAKG
jgi:hypothetical protein